MLLAQLPWVQVPFLQELPQTVLQSTGLGCEGSLQTESGKSYGSLETTGAPGIATGVVAGSLPVLPSG